MLVFNSQVMNGHNTIQTYVAIIEFDAKIKSDYILEDGNGDKYHKTVTVFEPDVERESEPFDYIEYLLLRGDNRELDIIKENPKSGTAIRQTEATVPKKEFSNNSISQNHEKSTKTSKKVSTNSGERMVLPDTAYLDAVNRGDTKTAQRMVDEAAKKAGYTVKAYHGTSAEFNIFKKSKRNAGFWFTTSKTYAAEHGHLVRSYFLKAEKTLKEDLLWDYAEKHFGSSVNEKQILSEEFLDILKHNNYDGIEFEHNGAITYVIISPDQIKSADPVTYDDNGDVIPLSQRFNSKNDDTRYALPDGVEVESIDTSSSVGKKRQEYKASVKERIFTAADSIYIDTVDEYYGAEKYLSKVGKRKNAASILQAIRASMSAAQVMIGDVQYDIFSDDGKKLGEGLSRIVKPITVKGDAIKISFNEYLMHWLNVDRMSLEEKSLARLEEMKAKLEGDIDTTFIL